MLIDTDEARTEFRAALERQATAWRALAAAGTTPEGAAIVLDLKAAVDEAERLKQDIFPELKAWKRSMLRERDLMDKATNL